MSDTPTVQQLVRDYGPKLLGARFLWEYSGRHNKVIENPKPGRIIHINPDTTQDWAIQAFAVTEETYVPGQLLEDYKGYVHLTCHDRIRLLPETIPMDEFMAAAEKVMDKYAGTFRELALIEAAEKKFPTLTEPEFIAKRNADSSSGTAGDYLREKDPNRFWAAHGLYNDLQKSRQQNFINDFKAYLVQVDSLAVQRLEEIVQEAKKGHPYSEDFGDAVYELLEKWGLIE